jgi:hypothetical protein
MKTENTAQILAEALSEAVNVLAPVVWPERFGPFWPHTWPSLRQAVIELQVAIDRFDGHAPPEFGLQDLARLLAVLRDAVEPRNGQPPDMALVRKIAEEIVQATRMTP